jgi:signal transduction histidine kinase
MLGKRFTESRDLRITPEMGRMVLLAMKARQPYRDFVYSRKAPDGKIRWFKLSGTPILDKGGVFQGYRGVGAEITSHVEAEQAARLAHRSLHDAVAHVTQPFVVYDAANRAIAFNQAFTDLFKQAVSKSPVVQGVSFRELAEWQLGFGFYAEGAQPPVTVEMLLEHYRSEREHTYHLRDGRWMLVVYRRLPGDGRVGLWTDVTAIKRAETERHVLEAQLHHSQRLEALGALAGGVAHEINNALVPVVALTKIVAAKLPEGSRERRNLDTVLGAAERSRDLVKQILAFSRKEQEQQRRGSVDVAAVMREALHLLRVTVPSSIRIEEDIAPAPPVTGDPSQLHQVIVNLATNAAQAIDEAHGTITLGLRAEADGAALRLLGGGHGRRHGRGDEGADLRAVLHDEGGGQGHRTRPRGGAWHRQGPWRPHRGRERARPRHPLRHRPARKGRRGWRGGLKSLTMKEVGVSTGLGLAVAHGIVAQHGGRIAVASAKSARARASTSIFRQRPTRQRRALRSKAPADVAVLRHSCRRR